jgi:alpha-galactosidase
VSTPGGPTPLAVQSAGVALVVLPHADGSRLPEVLHWGSSLPGPESVDALALVTAPPVPASSVDAAWPLTLLPSQADGWSGTPGLAGHRGGGAGAVRWTSVGCEVSGTAIVTTARSTSGLSLLVRHALDDHGLLTVEAEVTNTSTDPVPFEVTALRATMPLPARADEVLDLTGRWCRERSPQRARLDHGTHLRASRRGRTGHDATLLLVAGTTGFGWRHGEVWAVHTAWSGNHESLVESLPEGAGRHRAVLGGGELLAPGEVRLGPGESYAAPPVVFVHSADGLDGLSGRIHGSLRARPTHPVRPRPVVLNTWEAVYFDTRLDHLHALADRAARVGVERFVLDDGWFGSRRDDRSGLGDWVVSDEVWPEGLDPLVDHLRELGLEFGLWFEPEMVNPDSDVVRAHPEWVLGPVAGHPRSWRSQQLLDLTQDDARHQLLERISALVERYGVDSIKWDHNRDLLEAVHTVPGADGPVVDAPAVHAHTLALYALLDELRSRHPRLDIESCSSGGGRIDLGILARTDRVWPSDCNDALERATIQRWTSLLVPPEMMGSHVGPDRAHTTHRVLDLGFRLLVALQGHAGLEWDLTTCSEQELEQIRQWTALVRELRPRVHTGHLVRSDADAGTVQLTGYVDTAADSAVFTVVRLATSPDALPGPLPLPGLDAGRSYDVRIRPEAGLPQRLEVAAPPWWERALTGPGLTVPGAVLTEVGLALPVLLPAQGFLLDVRAR